MHQKFSKNMSSVGADFRNLAPVLIHQALRQARTVVCEPDETFELEIPVNALPAVTVTVARLSGSMTGAAPVGDALALTRHAAQQKRPAPAGPAPERPAAKVLTSEVTRYTPVGPPPARYLNGPDPLDKKEWFRAPPPLTSVLSPGLTGSGVRRGHPARTV